MADINTCAVVGNLIGNPELKYTADSTPVAKFMIASNGFKKDDVSFIGVVVFGKTAESVCTYLSKGKRAGVTGRINQSRWETQTGEKRSKIEIIASQVQFLSPADKTNQSGNHGSGQSGYLGDNGKDNSSTGFDDGDDVSPF